MATETKKNIRFINTSEPVTTLYRDLVPMLTTEYNVELLVSSAVYRKDRNLESDFDEYSAVTVRKTFSGFFKSYTGVLAKISVHAFYALHAFFIMLFGKRVDLQVFLTQPPFFYIFGAVIKKFRKIPYFIVIMDLQPDEYVEFGYLKKDSFYVKILDRLSTKAFENANKIIVIGRCMAEQVVAKGINPDKVVFIPNWTSGTHGAPGDIADNKLREQQGWEDKFVLLYGGNTGNAQIFEDLINVAEQLIEHSHIVFAIVGGGSRFNDLQTWKAEKNLTNLVLLPFQHADHSLVDIYGAGNVNFISLRENCTGHGVPSKAYVSLAAGRAILFQGSSDCEIAQMVVEENIGYSVRTAEEIAAKVLKLSKDSKGVEAMGNRAAELSRNQYSADSSAGKYRDLINSLLYE